MDHQIDLTSTGGAEGLAGVGEEVRAAPSAFDPRTKGEVESEVGVGEQQNADGHRVRGWLSLRWRS